MGKSLEFRDPLEYPHKSIALGHGRRLKGIRQESCLVIESEGRRELKHLVMADGSVWRCYRLKQRVEPVTT